MDPDPTWFCYSCDEELTEEEHAAYLALSKEDDEAYPVCDKCAARSVAW